MPGLPRWIAALLLAALAATGGLEAWRRAAAGRSERYARAFERFRREHGRRYASREEQEVRFGIFKANLDYIEAENAKGHSYSLGVTAFADQTAEEVKEGYLGLAAPKRLWGSLQHLGTDEYSGAALPASVDWTAKGAVTAPKNQGQCGSCWAFSTTGALEGAWQISTGKLVPLSEQQLVDCATGEGLSGCSGGGMDAAFKYLEGHAACTEASYSYQAKDGKCLEASCTAGIPKGSVTGWRDVPVQDEKALMEAVAQQPVSVAIEADQMAFQFYKGGVLTQKCGSKLDHGVLLVGYGTENGTDYWTVKNSWGNHWGEGGYIRIKRGVPKDGECGIKDGPTYPVVKAAEQEPLVAGVVGESGAVAQMLAISKALRAAARPSEGEARPREEAKPLVAGVVGDLGAIPRMGAIARAMKAAAEARKSAPAWSIDLRAEAAVSI